MQYAIKPCPFCGAPGFLMLAAYGFKIKCTDTECTVETPIKTHNHQVIELWNRRTAMTTERDSGSPTARQDEKSQPGEQEASAPPQPSPVPVPLDVLEMLHRVLSYYGNLCTYQGERIGGVLAGCPRGPAPTPNDLVREARIATEKLERFYRSRTDAAPPQPSEWCPDEFCTPVWPCSRCLAGESKPMIFEEAPDAAPPQPCGHPASLLLHSAETGAPLYCELCDDKSGRRDAEQREQELQAKVAELEETVRNLSNALRKEVEAYPFDPEGAAPPQPVPAEPPPFAFFCEWVNGEWEEFRHADDMPEQWEDPPHKVTPLYATPQPSPNKQESSDVFIVDGGVTRQPVDHEGATPD